MKISELDLLAGDCLNVSGNAFISRLIKFATSIHTKKAWCSHTACCLSNGLCIEALNKSKITRIKRYDNRKGKIKIYRLPLTEGQRLQFEDGAFEVANKMYGWTKLPLFALDAITTKIFSLFGRRNPVFFFTKHFSIFNIPVCSQLYVYILHKYCDYNLYDTSYVEVPWRIVSPDYLDDLMNLPMNKSVTLYKQGFE